MENVKAKTEKTRKAIRISDGTHYYSFDIGHVWRIEV